MRASGILLPIASLPSEFGIGAFDRSAYDFVDTLVKAGQGFWQILPMGPTGFGDSPYQSFSTFAGNPYFISLSGLREEGYLTKIDLEKYEASCGHTPHSELNQINYEKLYHTRFQILRKAYKSSGIRTDGEFKEFVAENEDWLPDYALFMAIKDSKGGQSFLEWEEDIRRRKPEAVAACQKEFSDDIYFYMFLQFEFSRQWNQLKEYANQKGIHIIGDIPIYVALDSADTWSHPELFQFTGDLEPVAVAGCPPDAFSETGQLWGNPLYDWKRHEATGFDWWIRRLEHCFRWYDMVRIDHFRGFDEYYSIPFGDADAVGGKWEKGPGIRLFEAMKEKLGEKDIIAEDLGFLTDSVRKLLRDTGYPGMKVLQFAFDSREESDYMPHNYTPNCVVYTGTHDNQTTYSWWNEMSAGDRDVAFRYMNMPVRFLTAKHLTWQLISMAQRSVANLCIIPAQDYLCLSKSARLNTPSTIGKNWQWRMPKGAFSDKLCKKIYNMTKLYGRLKK